MNEPKNGGSSGPVRGAQGPAVRGGEVPYGKLIRWGLFVVSGYWGPFIATMLLGIVNQTIPMFTVKLLGAIVARLQAPMAGVEAARAGALPQAHAHRDFVSSLIPHDPIVALQALAVLTFAGVLLVLAERVMTAWTDAHMLAHLQRGLHDQLLRLGPSYHQSHAVGETTAIVSRYASGAMAVLKDLIGFPLIRGVSLVTAIVLLVDSVRSLRGASVHLEVVVGLSILSMPIVSGRVAKRLRAAFTKVRDADLAVTEELQNSLAAPLEVQLMGAAPQRTRSFDDKLAVLVKRRFAASARNELANQFQSIMPNLLQLGFLAYGVMLAVRSHDGEAAGAVVTINGLVPLALQPIQQLVQYFAGLNSAWPQVEMVIEILEEKPDVADEAGAGDLPEEASAVALDGITFAYKKGLKPVLDDFRYTFVSGRTTALVGASGSGKSTIFNLVARLSDPLVGKITIGGKDLRSVKLASLRTRVVRVAQFPLFIADTVRANFLLARGDATDAEIEAVCRKTGLWEMLVRASGGSPLDMMLPRDVAQGLSGGQRRLLAISRALLHRPSVLLLDEPSTGIDNITLANLIRFLRGATAGGPEGGPPMTVLVIDHDLEGFISKIADRVCVLEDGRIAASGTHDELMQERDGLYARLILAAHAEQDAAPRSDLPHDRPLQKTMTLG